MVEMMEVIQVGLRVVMRVETTAVMKVVTMDRMTADLRDSKRVVGKAVHWVDYLESLWVELTVEC